MHWCWYNKRRNIGNIFTHSFSVHLFLSRAHSLNFVRCFYFRSFQCTQRFRNDIHRIIDYSFTYFPLGAPYTVYANIFSPRVVFSICVYEFMIR